jgi:ATP/maltotriose-dependent transcriptional regulator MalT
MRRVDGLRRSGARERGKGHRLTFGSARTRRGAGALNLEEAAILELLAAGMSNKEIARATDSGHETVKWHLKNLYGKLDAASRRHAVERARALGLLSAS